jgi:hypothetical protein
MIVTVGTVPTPNTRRALLLFCKPNTTYRIHRIILKNNNGQPDIDNT